MASVDATVNAMLRASPWLFASRGEALHFLFCVIGNGHAWVDGEIVNRDGTPAPWDEDAVRARHQERYSHLPAEVQEALAEVLEQEVAKERRALAHIEDHLQSDAIFRPIYPQSRYALLMQVPADVKPDWAESAKWMRARVSTEGWEF